MPTLKTTNNAAIASNTSNVPAPDGEVTPSEAAQSKEFRAGLYLKSELRIPCNRGRRSRQERVVFQWDLFQN